MSVFGNYANYYNFLYNNKDYVGEVNYITSLISRYAPNGASILDLGCGTGIHASFIAGNGYVVRGVDFSENMLIEAENRASSLPEDVASRISFEFGDICSYRTEQRFDAVISLFHVMSYQVSMANLHAAFEAASSHLKEGGIFVFDCWYGPAVLTERPEVRVRCLEDDLIRVTRIAEPTMHPNENRVDVDYQMFVADKARGKIEEIRETHRMRYLFLPEVDRLLADHDMERLAVEEWMTGKDPGVDTWGVCFVAQKMS